MNKNLLKVGALALGMFAFGFLYTNAQTSSTGDLSLTINAGTSECVYGTSLDLGVQEVKLDEAYTFTGNFGSEWSCTDLSGWVKSWTFTVESSDLTAGDSTIAATNVELQHPAAVVDWDTVCSGGLAQSYVAIDSAYTMMERSTGSDGVCKLTISDVDLRVNVPANQAPGAYTGTLTITLPTF